MESEVVIPPTREDGTYKDSDYAVRVFEIADYLSPSYLGRYADRWHGMTG